jgi:hypothetical protein
MQTKRKEIEKVMLLCMVGRSGDRFLLLLKKSEGYRMYVTLI